MKKFTVSAALIAAIGCSIGQSANAGEEIGLTVFSPQAPARAEDVNGNFNSLKTAIDGSNSRIGNLETLTSGLGAVKATVDANNTRLSTVETLTTGNTAAITGLSSAVDSKIDTVTAQSKIDTVQQSVNSKASIADLNALKTQVAIVMGTVGSIAYQKTPEYAGVTLSNTKLNDGSMVALVPAGSSISVKMDYAVRNPIDYCPNCIDQIQIGFSHNPTATGCVYSGNPGTTGVTGSGQITLTAPQQPGVYFVGFDRSQQYSCLLGWSAPNTFNRYIGVVIVQ